MLIPPHVPWALSKHAGAGDSAGKAALPPAHTPPRLPSSIFTSPRGPPTRQRCNIVTSDYSSYPYLSSEQLC